LLAATAIMSALGDGLDEDQACAERRRGGPLRPRRQVGRTGRP
jgi:hypothetical protein